MSETRRARRSRATPAAPQVEAQTDAGPARLIDAGQERPAIRRAAPPEVVSEAPLLTDGTIPDRSTIRATPRAAGGGDRDAGLPTLRATSPKPPLGHGGSPLPQLTERQQRPRRWWAHPAFIVSLVLTFLALAGAAAWAIVSALTSSEVIVSNTSIAIDGNLHLDWDGPEADYSLFAVNGDGSTLDLTQFVRGDEAWIYSAAGMYDADTCFVVRGTEWANAEISLNADVLASQNAQSICVSDAAS